MSLPAVRADIHLKNDCECHNLAMYKFAPIAVAKIRADEFPLRLQLGEAVVLLPHQLCVPQVAHLPERVTASQPVVDKEFAQLK